VQSHGRAILSERAAGLAELAQLGLAEAAVRAGVILEDGPTGPAHVRRLGPDELELTIREGRNRQVRRMCETVGHRVLALRRVGFGSLTLGRLAPGAHRRLGEAEVRELRGAGANDRGEAGPRL
jgi:16S rRNA U516 pseudouridylate synthase RsuA-like enzyme